MNQDNPINTLNIDDTPYETLLTRKFIQRKPYSPDNPNKILAFIPGIIREINVKKGLEVKKGTQLLILEAMKMKNSIQAPFDAKIKSINVEIGKMVTKNQLLIELE
ncbi:MAG TPA: acetyl-CoA carboxylase biotin carboxyl carrier protein subunit [Candidatus Kapabacteria bacterium]|nr:acetyl-CoA carboxylase biotin carboxyl carrier protein subunit [Candidatus Kapabacteria bacterium]HPO64154.1 acetyl-CoA carboxylase biotin carboxyl carrier protein subunit [Candidatus Kapabacteria bacterium]